MRLRTVAFWLLLLGLLLPAVALTVARAVEPAGEVWLELEAFTPLALPAYAAAALLLLARVVLPGRGLRVVWLLLALLLVLPMGLHAWWYAPQVLGANPPAAAGAEPLRVLTANSLRGEVDALGLVQEASAADADLVVVQEITRRELATLESGGLDAGWPHRAGEPGVGIDGTMIFSRLPLGGTTRLATAMDSWAVTVTTPDGDLRLLAVHAWPPTDPARWRADHAVIRAAAREADLVVGDLNASPDHRPLRALAHDGLRSVAELANEGWQPTWPVGETHSFLGIELPALTQIDHVLVGDRLSALSSRTIALDGTDHLAVLAEVAFQ